MSCLLSLCHCDIVCRSKWSWCQVIPARQRLWFINSNSTQCFGPQMTDSPHQWGNRGMTSKSMKRKLLFLWLFSKAFPYWQKRSHTYNGRVTPLIIINRPGLQKMQTNQIKQYRERKCHLGFDVVINLLGRWWISGACKLPTEWQKKFVNQWLA